MNSNALPSFLTTQLIVILEDSIERLGVLHCTNDYLINHSRPKLAGGKEGLFPSLKEPNDKFLRLSSITDDTNNDDDLSYYEKIINVELDRKFVEDCLNKLRSDIITNGEYTHFTQILRIEQENELKFSNQKIMQAKFNSQLNKVQQSIDNFEIETDSQKKELGMVLQNLKNQKQEIIQKNKMQQKLAQAEMHQKIESAKDECSCDIHNLNFSIANISQVLATEKSVHRYNLEDFRLNYTNLDLDKEQFIKYYNEQKEKIIGSINYYTKSSSELKKKLKKLSRKHQNYLSVVEEHNLQKAKLHEEEMKINFRIKKANDIQNWWRWIIVRDNLVSKTKKKSRKKK